MQSNSRVTLSVFAIASFLFGIASIGLAVPFFWKQYQVVARWPAATAQVRRSEVVEVTQGGQRLFSTRFELSFDAAGKLVITTVNGYRQSFERARALEAASLFPQGSQALVRYDPANPSEVRLDTDHPRRYYQIPIALCITGIIFIAIASALFYITKL